MYCVRKVGQCSTHITDNVYIVEVSAFLRLLRAVWYRSANKRYVCKLITLNISQWRRGSIKPFRLKARELKSKSLYTV